MVTSLPQKASHSQLCKLGSNGHLSLCLKPGFLFLCCTSSKGLGGLLNSSCTHSHTHNHTHNSLTETGGEADLPGGFYFVMHLCLCRKIAKRRQTVGAGASKEGVFRKILLKSQVDIDSLRSLHRWGTSWREKLTL